MDDKRIAKLAKKVAKAEKKREYVENVSEIEEEIESLISGLSVEDLMAIDDYIISHHLAN